MITEVHLTFMLALVSAIMVQIVCGAVAAYTRRPSLAVFGAGVVNMIIGFSVVSTLMPGSAGVVIGVLLGGALGYSTYFLSLLSIKRRFNYE